MADVKVWRYYLPNESSLGGWAEVTVCSSGMFAAFSDYGNYAFAWRSFGDGDFRLWLADLENNPSYVMSKLNGSRRLEYNGEATLREIRRHILDHRREGDYDKKRARREWDLLGEHGDLHGEHDFSRWYDETSLDCAYEFRVEEYPGLVRAFCDRVMPRLAKVLRAQVEAERKAA